MTENKQDIEETLAFSPQFNEQGLIPCITTSAHSEKVLMFAWMNEEALQKTLETGEAHYWSRSRNELWHKGATSGFTQKVVEMRIDCDQDCLWLHVEVAGADTGKDETACHTGRNSCFYRILRSEKDAKEIQLEFIDENKS